MQKSFASILFWYFPKEKRKIVKKKRESK